LVLAVLVAVEVLEATDQTVYFLLLLQAVAVTQVQAVEFMHPTQAVQVVLAKEMQAKILNRVRLVTHHLHRLHKVTMVEVVYQVQAVVVAVQVPTDQMASQA
jgi:hypothetical protein